MQCSIPLSLSKTLRAPRTFKNEVQQCIRFFIGSNL